MMFGHYVLTLYRTLTRHRLYAALNVLGLAVGIAVFLVLWLDVRFETSFDRWIPDATNIYRFTSIDRYPNRPPGVFAMSSATITPAFRADYPHVGEVTRLVDAERPLANGALLGLEHTDYVDANFFHVLDLPLAAGDKMTALADPDDVVITEAIARKYFGATAVLGRSLTLYYHGHPRIHRVAGVLKDLPANSSLKLAVVAPLSPAILNDTVGGLLVEDWADPSGYTFVRFANATQARAVAADLARFAQRRAHGSRPTPGSDLNTMIQLQLTPLTALHFVDARTLNPMKPGVDGRIVYALGWVGALTLAIAVLNYVNLATATSALRAREIAVRKVMGATRAALLIQLLAESIALALTAVLVGIMVTELALPVVNALTGSALTLNYWNLAPLAAALGLAVGLGAGAYPALLSSRFEPAAVLASARTPGGGREQASLRAILIGAQFAVAIGFTICTVVVGAQARFIREADRGFRPNGLILLDTLNAVQLTQRQNHLLDVMRSVPGVVSATASWRDPGPLSDSVTTVHRPGTGVAAVALSQDLISDGYLATYGGTVVAGRMFDRAHAGDDVAGDYGAFLKGGPREVGVMLNETAVRALGFASPAQAVGQRIVMDEGPGGAETIVGILKDSKFGSPLHPVPGVIYLYDSQPFGGGAVGAVRFAGVPAAVMMDRLRAVWRREAPMVPFRGQTAQASLSDFYQPDERRARLFSIGSALAVGIGCIGLYGLATFNTARRFKEIGIRKTLGASTLDVLKLLLAQIMRPVLLANLIAWPVAWLLMRRWLGGFDQRIDLSPLFFLAASLLALTVAALTVLAQSLRLARAEPAKALHHE
jgi:putative ABC transport system permease protein